MEREHTSILTSERKKYLNIVYFVESARSHNIRINLKFAQWCLGLAILIGTWAIGSIGWILSLNQELNATRFRLQTSLTTIFDYQVKNDKIFDTAYPVDATNSYYSESALLSSNSPTDEKQNDKSSDKTTNNTPAPVSETPTKSDAVSVASNSPTASTDKDTQQNKSTILTPLIIISNTNVTKYPNKISLAFDMTNKNATKSEGYVWAVAQITQSDGNPLFISAPEHTKIDPQDGKIKAIKTAYRFSIQRFKNKIFEFKIPTAKDWKLTTLKIHYSNVSGTSDEIVDVPVDHLAVNSGSPSKDMKAE